MISLLALPACTTVPKGIGDYDAGYLERGIASWYGGYFHGRPTANGEIYDQFKMTAAHRMLPLGSVVRVTNAENGRAVDLVINDRGPFIRGRIIDLSYAAAEWLGGVTPGTLPVVVEVIQMGNRGANASTVRAAGPEQDENPGARFSTLLPGKSEGFPGGDARIFAVHGSSGLVVRDPMDVLRDPRRARRLSEPETDLDEHPDHTELIEGITQAFA